MNKKHLKETIFFNEEEITIIKIDDDWYYSVLDIIRALTGHENPSDFWSILQSKQLKLGNELYIVCVQLEVESEGEKHELIDCTDMEGVLRIMQYIPSRHNEKFESWIASLDLIKLTEMDLDEEEISEFNKGLLKALNYRKK